MGGESNEFHEPHFIVSTNIGDVLATPSNSTIRLFKTGLIDRLDIYSPDGRVLALFCGQELLMQMSSLDWPTYDQRNTETDERDISIACAYFSQEIAEACESDLWKNGL